jgi:hypothetical protein
MKMEEGMEGHNFGLPPLEEQCDACGGTGNSLPAKPGEIPPFTIIRLGVVTRVNQ